MLLLKYSKTEWKSLGLWTRFKLKLFAICWKEILQIEVQDENRKN